jgi:hypothetical protein
MVDDKCCGCYGMVQGAFPNMEGVAVPKKKKKEQKIRKENREWLMTNVVGAMAWFRVLFPIWKVWLCQKKKKRAENQERK